MTFTNEYFLIYHISSAKEQSGQWNPGRTRCHQPQSSTPLIPGSSQRSCLWSWCGTLNTDKTQRSKFMNSTINFMSSRSQQTGGGNHIGGTWLIGEFLSVKNSKIYIPYAKIGFDQQRKAVCRQSYVQASPHYWEQPRSPSPSPSGTSVLW